MSARVAIVVLLAGWAGATLLLAELPWFSRAPLAERLAPYTPGMPGRRRSDLLAVREWLTPLASRAGERVAVALGVMEPLATRLARVHAEVEPTTFRLRQVGSAVVGFGLGGLAALSLGLAPVVATAFLLAGAALGFLVEEQRLSSAGDRWRRQVFTELPVVAEQVAMLLGAGWSLTAALERTSTRGSGAVAKDLRRVLRRVQQGLSTAAALEEWAEIAGQPAVTRLVAVLSLQHETTDLGRLVAEEAKALRRESHRELVEAVERRNQQVWIPVTVAALVPGALFMAIPFVEALRLFGG